MRPTHIKYRLLIDLDETLGPIQCTASLEALDGSSTHRITTWTPGPFETPQSVLAELIGYVEERYGVQLELPL